MQTIAVLGLGKMGHAIASCLLNAGYNVNVWNRTTNKATDLIARGAVLAETPGAAARHASVVFSMVADDEASSAVWLGAAGAFDVMQAGSFAVECSTVSSAHLNRIATTAKEKDLKFIDCPVTGLPGAAEAGRLTLLVGADPADLEGIRPVLENMSVQIRYFGAVGTGNAYKLIINLMGAVQIAALAEGVAMANNLGLDKEVVIAAIENSAAASPQVVRHVRKMAEADFETDPSFTTTLRYKDALYALELGRSSGNEIPLGIKAAEWFEAASLAYPGMDEAAVIRMLDYANPRRSS